jgi:predicted NodU family carbamoyl transferase
LNKRIAARNKWREYATKALQEASKQYLEDLKAKSPDDYAKAIENRQRRETRKERIPLPLRSAEAQRLLDEMQKLEDVELLAHYYHGRKPGRISKKTKTKYPKLLETLKEMAKK